MSRRIGRFNFEQKIETIVLYKPTHLIQNNSTAKVVVIKTNLRIMLKLTDNYHRSNFNSTTKSFLSFLGCNIRYFLFTKVKMRKLPCFLGNRQIMVQNVSDSFSISMLWFQYYVTCISLIKTRIWIRYWSFKLAIFKVQAINYVFLPLYLLHSKFVSSP